MESKWFVDENVKNIDKEILLCFPYAGASINMFSMWKEYIDKVIVCPVKLPFRDARRKEKLPESVQKLAEVFVKENIDIMRKRYSIFGHCTGAILGYEIARQTYEKTGNEPTVTSSPTFTSGLIRVPLSLYLPLPTARTLPCCGFSFTAVSGRKMPLAVFSSTSTTSTIT